MKKGKKILIALAVLLVLGVISGIGQNLSDTPSEEIDSNQDSSAEDAQNDQGSPAEETPENNQDIIWKDDENMGILNLELDGTKTKEGIVIQYYTEIASYLRKLDTADLKDYDHIQFVGNVMNDGKIECTIKGNLSIDFIKNSEHLSTISVEDNMTELFIPKPLQ